jgi:hypothetical protein
VPLQRRVILMEHFLAMYNSPPFEQRQERLSMENRSREGHEGFTKARRESAKNAEGQKAIWSSGDRVIW